jgi:hypothetical protein
MSSDRRGLSNRFDALVGHAHGHDTVEKTGITYFGPETGRTRPYRLRGAIRRDSSTNAQNLLEDAVQQFQRAIDLNPNFSARNRSLRDCRFVFGSKALVGASARNVRYACDRYPIAALQRTADFPSPQTSGYVDTGRFGSGEETWPR